MNKLNLNHINDNINQLEHAYALCKYNNHYVFDGDLEQLFADSDITIDKTICKAKNYQYNDDGWLINCKNGDYLETLVLIQNGQTYLCQAFSESCFTNFATNTAAIDYNLDYTLALTNIIPVDAIDIYGILL